MVGAVLVAVMRYEERSHSIGSSLWFMLFASAFLLPAPFVYGFGELSLELLALGVATGLGYVFMVYCLGCLEAEPAAIARMIFTPAFAIAIAFLAIGEALQPTVLLGGAILLAAGVYLERALFKR